MNRRAFWQGFADQRPEQRRTTLDAAATGVPPGFFDVPFCHGRTPLGLAAAENAVVLADDLLQRGADPNVADMAGRCPLHVAIARGHRELAELLIDRGADIQAPDASLRTPLMYALFDGDAGLARRLITAGARQTDVDVDGRTVQDYAAQAREDKDTTELTKLLDKRSGRRKRAPYPATLTVPEFRRFRAYQDYLRTPWQSLGYAAFFIFLVGAGGYSNFFLLQYALPVETAGTYFAVGPFNLAAFGSWPGLAIFAALCAGLFLIGARRDLGTGGRRPSRHPAAPSTADVSDLARGGAREVCHLLRHGSVALLHSTERIDRDPVPWTKADSFRFAHGACLTMGMLLFAAACTVLGSIYVAMYLNIRGDMFPDMSNLVALAATTLLGVLVATCLLGLGSVAQRISLREVTLRQRQRDANAGEFLAEAGQGHPTQAPFALYLRSFRYDRALRLNGADLEATLVYSIGRSLEVIALGQPGNLGAARVSSTDAQWRGDFSRLSAGAVAIFLIPGDTDGTLWEIDALRASRAFERTVFVMPPDANVGDAWVSQHWRRMLAHPRLANLEFPSYRANGAVFTLNNDGSIRSWGPIGIETIPLPLLVHLGGADGGSSGPLKKDEDLSEEIDGEHGVLELGSAGGDAGGADDGGGDGGGGE